LNKYEKSGCFGRMYPDQKFSFGKKNKTKDTVENHSTNEKIFRKKIKRRNA